MTDFIATATPSGIIMPMQAIDRWAKGQKPNTKVLMRVLKVMPHRKDVQHNLYRLRNGTLAIELDVTADYLHEYIGEECNLGEFRTIEGKAKFVRKSQKLWSVAEMNIAFKKQDDLAAFVNEGREQHELLILPTGEP